MRFDGLKYPVHELSEDDRAVTTWPELLTYKAIKNRIDDWSSKRLDQVVRYVILLYDPDSDLIKEFPNLQERKEEAARLVSLDLQDEFTKAVMNCSDVKVTDIILTFIGEIYHNRRLREWHVLCQELDYLTKRRFKFGEDKENFETISERKKLREECERIHQAMDLLEEEMFSGDKDLLHQVEINRWASPEAFAKIYTEE